MKGKAIRIVMALLLILCLAASVSAKEIIVLSQFPLSGPLGALPEIGWGYIDGMNWLNKEGGGVNGKPIKWFMEDMRYTPNVEVANFTKFTSQHGRDEFLMASGYITGGIIALAEKVNKEEKIPWIDGSYSTEMFEAVGGQAKYPYYYSMGATYAPQMKILVKWILDNHKGPGKARIGFVYSPTAYGRDGTPQAIAYAKEKGLDVVAEIEYPYTATAATNECMTLRKAKAQYVIYHGYTGTMGATAIFFKTAKQVIPETQLMGTAYMGGRFPILLMGEAYDGFIGAYCNPFYDAVPRSATPMDNAWVKMVHEFAQKYRGEEYKKDIQGGGIKDITLYEIGLRYAFMIHKALVEADKAGDLSRDGVRKALDNLVWDFKGMFGGKTFSFKSHSIPMLRLYRAKVKLVAMGDKKVPTGLQAPITDWINTDEVKW
ncbi:MAG: ABC transporter substrate-binding protein [Proteobacteria bacterium]|nr:ABC transporter substrate-binding protein [Pseudomonadota bacterium]